MVVSHAKRMLKLVDETAGAAQLTVDIVNPTKGVALIDVILAEEAVPLHWRVGDWTKPPLDIQLGRDGRLIGVQFVLQDEGNLVQVKQALPSIQRSGILPIFDVTGWSLDRYEDVKIAVAYRRVNDLLMVDIGDNSTTRWIAVGGFLTLGFNEVNELVSLIVGPLSESDWRKMGDSGDSLDMDSQGR